MSGIPVRLVGVFSRPGRDPRGWVVSAAFAGVIREAPPVTAGDDAATAAWYQLERREEGLVLCREGETVRAEELAFDHGEILAAALKGCGVEI